MKYVQSLSEMENKPENYLYSVAIDLGTTYSGYYFSFSGDDNMYANRNWGAEVGQQSYKTPTSVLTSLSDDGCHRFEAFGFEAEQRYTNKANETSDVYLFEKFKMQLHGNKVSVYHLNDFLFKYCICLFVHLSKIIKTRPMACLRQNMIFHNTYFVLFTFMLQ